MITAVWENDSMSQTVTETEPRKCPRTVFGRLERNVEGHPYKFEMKADGLHVRKKRSRKEQVVSFLQLLDAATGQLRLI